MNVPVPKKQPQRENEPVVRTPSDFPAGLISDYIKLVDKLRTDKK